MPRYFFHTRLSDQLIRDTIGLELPEIASAEDPELILALWHEAFDKHLKTEQSFVVTDATGKVVFATAF